MTNQTNRKIFLKSDKFTYKENNENIFIVTEKNNLYNDIQTENESNTSIFIIYKFFVTQSKFYNPNYLADIRQTGAPELEI